ncbi:valacyclovir hydrolase-like [Oppia nitens]|uniref:valacyclovir hydrolase-like n=1 Tax=Oppia nitens TaxID=1686743 RepID=UPI0023DA3368|nr:valacyclovir hydrolase-like [Oppia nitens]
MTSGGKVVDINGWTVWYEKFGTGPEIMLFLPDAIGSGRQDFIHQLEGPQSFSHNEYTIIVMDLPGWGRSRPPERPYGQNVYVNDADVAARLMEILCYKNYILFCFGEGGKVGLTMSVRYPSRIKGLVLISIFMIISPETVAPILATVNTRKWIQEMRDNYLPVYGNQDSSLQNMWDKYIDFLKSTTETCPNGFVIESDKLESIGCPILIIHGNQDQLISLDHPKYIDKYVPDCQLHSFPNGGHNCHQRYPVSVKRISELFFISL